MRVLGNAAVLVGSITMLATTAVAQAPNVGQAALPQGVPRNYRQLIVQEVKTVLAAKDFVLDSNFHVHDAVISEPEVYTGLRAIPWGRVVTYCVMFRVGATDDVRIYTFADGKLVSSGSLNFGSLNQRAVAVGLYCDGQSSPDSQSLTP